MTGSVVASAPGKVVLSGEYAVLDGAPAIAMAVNRRAVARVSDLAGGESTVTALGALNETGRFRVADNAFEWLEGGHSFGVVGSAWRTAGITDSRASAIHLDTRQFVDPTTREKTGLGSSAAITVALCAALQRQADARITSAAAQAAHADFQQGAGSGVDVACSVAGGLLDYCLDSAGSNGARVTPLVWPQGLYYRLIYSGVSASTQSKLSALAAVVEQPSRARLAEASGRIAIAWRSGDAARILDEYREYVDCLRAFSIDHGAGVFDAGHDDIRRAAESVDIIYKPCGAGGGDVGIALATDDNVLDAFIQTLAGAYTVLDVRLSTDGVRLETADCESI